MSGVSFSAARMIQTAYELDHASSHLSPLAVLLLQLSANLLADPDEAQVRFYGLSPSCQP